MTVNPGDISAVTDAITFITSAGVSIFLSGARRGSTDRRLLEIEKNQDKSATKEQLNALKEQVAEIKGMFRMTLKGDE